MEPPPLDLVDKEEDYEVKGILWHKDDGAQRHYLVLWKGYQLTKIGPIFSLIVQHIHPFICWFISYEN